MRRMGMVVLAVGFAALPAQADEVYSWVDGSGTRHYSNVPTETAAPTGLDAPTASFTTSGAAEPLGADVVQNVAARADGPEAAEGTLERLEDQKALKEIDARLAAIDREMDELARARTAHAKGTPQTGGLGTRAADYLSPEEEALGAEREQLVKQASKLRDADAALP